MKRAVPAVARRSDPSAREAGVPNHIEAKIRGVLAAREDDSSGRCARAAEISEIDLQLDGGDDLQRRLPEVEEDGLRECFAEVDGRLSSPWARWLEACVRKGISEVGSCKQTCLRLHH